MNKFAPLLLVLLLVSSCSNEDESDMYVSELIGKWNVENSTPGFDSRTLNKQNKEINNCRIFAIIINSDGSFILNTDKGKLRGSYSVESKTSLRLDNKGYLKNIEIRGNQIDFFLELKDLCEFGGNAKKDPSFSEGDCTSFLDCHDGLLWMKRFDPPGDETRLQFIEVRNNLGGEWWNYGVVRYNGIGEELCILELERKDNLNNSVILLKNDPAELLFVLKTPTRNVVVEYKTIESDYGSPDLYSQYFYPDGTFSEAEHYNMRKTESIESYLQFSGCE